MALSQLHFSITKHARCLDLALAKRMTQKYKLKYKELLRVYKHLQLPEVVIHGISWALACNFYLLCI